MSATSKDLKDARVVIPTTRPFNSPVWLVQKTDGSWRMTTDCQSFTKGWLEFQLLHQMWFYSLSKLTHPLVPNKQLLIQQMPFYSYISIRFNRSSLFAAGKTNSTLSLSCHCLWRILANINPQGLCHNLVRRDLGCLSSLHDITLIHMDDMMLIGPCEQEVATILYLLVRDLCVRVWEISVTKI